MAMDAAALQRDALYLVHQLLSDICAETGAFADTVASLARELDESSAFGESTGWNGQCVPLLLDVLQKKHSRLPSKLLLTHLGSLVQANTRQSTAALSLLRIEDTSRDDQAKVDEYRRISRRLVDATVQLTAKHTEMKKLEQKLAELDEALQLQGTEGSESAAPTEALKQMGVHRERRDVVKRETTLQVLVASLQGEVSECVDDLRHMGRLGGETYRGVCLSSTSWLSNRRLGNTCTYACSAGHGLARVLSSSVRDVRQRMRTAFHHTWTTSGHYLAPAYCTVFDRSGRYAITGADDALVKVWDVMHGQLVMTLRGHKGYITLVAVSPDNSLIASSCTLGDIRLWRVSNGECMALLKHNGAVNWIKFDENTGALASGGEDGFAYVWDLSVHLPSRDGSFPLTEVVEEEAEADKTTSRDTCLSPEPSTSPVTRGVFPWSLTSNSKGKLPLPHNQLADSGALPPVNVLCLDIAPTGGFVATGREDGMANIWSYAYKGGPPGRESPANTSDPISALNKLRGDLSPREWAIMESIANHLIVRLVGHVAPITDIKFNSRGDRLITGSMKEGTVRVWSFSSGFAKSDHIVLSMSDDSSSTSNTSNPMRRQRQTRSKNQLYSVSWSYDDMFIFTLQSGEAHGDSYPSTLKMWNSSTGLLLSSLVVSDMEANVLTCHPSMSAVVMTGGADGMVNVWSAESQLKCFEFANLCPPDIPNIDYKTPIKILDASFSSDGLRLSVADHIGRLLMFSLEDPTRYQRVETEQYFSSDYNDMYYDDDGLPIDVGTNLPVHMLSNSYLCRMDGSAYAQQVLVRMENVTIAREQVQRELIERRRISTQVVLDLDASYRHFKRAKQRLSTLGNTTRSALPVAAAKPATQRSARPHVESIYKDPPPYFDNVESDGNSEKDPDWISLTSSDGETMFRRRTHVPSTRGSQRQGSEAHRPSRSQRARRAERAERRGTSSSVYVDGVHVLISDSESSSGNESQALYDERPKRQRSAARKTTKKRVSRAAQESRRDNGTEDAVEEASPRRSRPLAWEKGSAAVPLDVLVYRDWTVQEEPSDYTYCPQVGDSVVYFPQGHAEHLRLFHETSQPPWTNFPSRWAVVECRVVSIDFELPTEAEYKRCTSIVARIGLTITGIPMHVCGTSGANYSLTEFSNPSTRRFSLDRAEFSYFTVSIRKAAGIPDFILPSYLYRRAASVRWRAGMKFQTPFLDVNTSALEHYRGTIMELGDFDSTYPSSPWECLKVKWESDDDGQELSSLGPWDAFLVEDGVSSSLGESLKLPKYRASVLSNDVKERLEAAVTACLENEKYEPFAYPIDPEAFPDYLCIVPTPIYLDAIQSRIHNDYYRQVEAFEFDVNLLYYNCELYNLEGTAIIELAEELRSLLLDSVKVPSRDVNQEEAVDEMEAEEEEPMIIRFKRKKADVEEEVTTTASSPMKISLRTSRYREEETKQEFEDESQSRRIKQSSTGRGSRVSLSKDMRNREESSNATEVVSSGVSTRGKRGRLSGASEDNVLDKTEVTVEKPSRGRPRREPILDSSEVKAHSRDRRISRNSFVQTEKSDEDRDCVVSENSPDRDLVTRSGRKVVNRLQEKNAEERAMPLRSPSERKVERRVSYAEDESEDEEEEEDDDDGESSEASAETLGRVSTRGRSREKRESGSKEGNSKETARPAGRRRRTSKKPRIAAEEAQERRAAAPATGKRVDPLLKRQMLDLLSCMEALDTEFIFAEPITEDIAPGYFKIIDQPLDISTIRDTLARRQYENVSQLGEDLRTMYCNCLTYNDPESALFELATEHLDILEQNLQDLLQKSDEDRGCEVNENSPDRDLVTRSGRKVVNRLEEKNAEERAMPLRSPSERKVERRVSYAEDESEDEEEEEDDDDGESSEASAESLGRVSTRGRSREKRESGSKEGNSKETARPAGRRRRTSKKPRIAAEEVQERRAAAAATGKRVDPLLKRQMLDLLSCMEALDTEFIFAEPITEDIAPGYFKIIDQPLDISTIRDKLARRQYENVSQLGEDLRTMYCNCLTYNEPESALFELATEHLDILEQNLQDLLQ